MYYTNSNGKVIENLKYQLYLSSITNYTTKVIHMSMAEVKVKEWGNSIGVIIPKDIAEHEGIHKGDTLKIDIIKAKRMDFFGIYKGYPKYKKEEESHEEFWQ